MKRRNVFVVLSFAVLMVACDGHSTKTDTSNNPLDTMEIAEGLTDEESIAYIEDSIIQSPISAKDLLGLAEVHAIEECLNNYNNFEEAKKYPEYADDYIATHRDSASMRLANRFMRMSYLVNMNGNASDKLQWAIAVNAVLDTFRVAVPSISPDSTLNEIARVMNKFSSLTQDEMNMQSYVDATVDYYRTIEAYRQWLTTVPAELKPLAQKEYETWHDFNEARFSFWKDVSYSQENYSMKPLEVEGYYENLSSNRRAELDIERSIIKQGKPYRQRGTTVTTQQWEKWIADNSVLIDIEVLRDMDWQDLIPTDSLVTNRVNDLKSTFSRWIAARQSLASALSKQQGNYYDYLTADIHCSIIGKLPSLIPYKTGE